MLPFSTEQFFAVFSAYNARIWPAQIAAYGLGALAVWCALSGRRWGSGAAAVLGVFWLWNGIAYHLAFFTSINPAAYGFGVLFVAQGLLFLGYGAAADNLSLRAPTGWRGSIAIGMIIYSGIVYPVLGMALGHGWPRAPMFGVAPCPTAIFTFGLLMLSARPLPIWLLCIPLAWAGIGSTAAVLLGVREDLGLLVSGILAAMLLPSWGWRRSSPATQCLW